MFLHQRRNRPLRRGRPTCLPAMITPNDPCRRTHWCYRIVVPSMPIAKQYVAPNLRKSADEFTRWAVHEPPLRVLADEYGPCAHHLR